MDNNKIKKDNQMNNFLDIENVSNTKLKEFNDYIRYRKVAIIGLRCK